MARAAKPKKEISMEEALWKSADKLRGSVEPAEYKHVVLSLFFLKFASDKFEECRNKIIATHGEKYADMKPFYTQENVFYLPEESRWKYIIENAKQDDIALKIDTALYTIEKNNPALKGALPDNYYSRLHIDTAKASIERPMAKTNNSKMFIMCSSSCNSPNSSLLFARNDKLKMLRFFRYRGAPRMKNHFLNYSCKQNNCSYVFSFSSLLA